MNTEQAYNLWSSQYDTNVNRTRDLEGVALKETLSKIEFISCLEIGCGTGKNTIWLSQRTKHITAVDLSEEMISKAKEKTTGHHVEFKKADITKNWTFAKQTYDLVTFSLVLEHIENLEHIFKEAAKVMKNGGYLYVGELHPFKQYAGSKARFDLGAETIVVDCFNHNISDFTSMAKQSGFVIVELNEYFDDNNRSAPPRILALLFQKADIK